jgi:hypothetical protein
MKNIFSTIFILFLAIICFPRINSAQDLPYTEGSVWDITFVRTKPGMDLDYLKSLAAEWQKQNVELKKQGVILSYKILSGSPANQEDWDLMLMVEYKNMAALDGIVQKYMNVVSKMRTEDQQRTGYIKRSEMRDILGDKVVRELILK